MRLSDALMPCYEKISHTLPLPAKSFDIQFLSPPFACEFHAGSSHSQGPANGTNQGRTQAGCRSSS
ncbi:hypothetical protein MPNT_30060 [Candidatus Methylacidithermus pantelleriae]|uniref:Uncharacterized protein n=1 Tax=Candidatus Methylacidithermus pantelleriae TaxID=2744239 RepID=A0A8J2FSV3_9BACT|nr:hypothetical protein MPNT_30060 [Candidatus Methylacidithermus pantelleriae]